MRAHAEADAAEEGLADRPEGPEQRSYWNEVPRFRDMWAEHEKHWPTDRQPAADRPDDPPGSYRSKGGFYLAPEQHTETIEAIGRVREAEPPISADLRAVERENAYGGWLEGFNRRLKGEERLKEKVAEKLEAESGMTAPRALGEVADAIRFTCCSQPEDYASGYYDIKERLESHGHEMYYSNNWWTDREYKGINTRWVTVDGQRFEVQFHTPESLHAKEFVTHAAYERIRDPVTLDEERGELENFQRAVSAWIEVPDGATDIPDVKKEGF